MIILAFNLTTCATLSRSELNFEAFQQCVKDINSQNDLDNIKTYLLKVGAIKIPEDWSQRFCESTQYKRFEYVTATESITGAPIVIQQVDLNCDGDALVPHNLVIGGHKMPKFEINSLDRNPTDQFNSWNGDCVPFLFERESEEKWMQAVKSGSLYKVVYYIATLCRRDKFNFKYYIYNHPKWYEIDAKEFPKKLALENIWYYQSADIQYARHTPKFIQDGLKVSDDAFSREKMKIDPERNWFYTGLTARMWAHIESGVDFWEFDDHFSEEEAKEHAVRYQNKYSIK